MIVDTSVLLAYFDASEPDFEHVSALLESSSEPLVVSAFVLAELDYLVTSRLGVQAELAVLDQLLSGAWDLASHGSAELERARDIVRAYADHAVGIADAMNIVLANAYRTRTIATLDRRHYSVLRLADGTAPVLVP